MSVEFDVACVAQNEYHPESHPGAVDCEAWTSLRKLLTYPEVNFRTPSTNQAAPRSIRKIVFRGRACRTHQLLLATLFSVAATTGIACSADAGERVYGSKVNFG